MQPDILQTLAGLATLAPLALGFALLLVRAWRERSHDANTYSGARRAARQRSRQRRA